MLQPKRLQRRITPLNKGNAKMSGLNSTGMRAGKAGKQTGKAGNNGHLTVFRGSRR